jgi:hypothetical protein
MPTGPWKVLISALLLVLASRSGAVERSDDPVGAVIPNLHALSHSSGYIFSGTVVRVERIVPRDKSAVEVMSITFRVEEAFRGVTRGQKLEIREWAGLWQSGERYRPGERVMLFLYPPSKLGLTSPVSGAMGRFRISPDGQIIVPHRPSRPGLSRIPEGRHAQGFDLLTLRDLAHALEREFEERP